MNALWEPYKGGSLTGHTSDSSDIQRQLLCGPEQTFERASQKCRSTRTIRGPRRARTRRGRVTFDHYARKATTP